MSRTRVARRAAQPEPRRRRQALVVAGLAGALLVGVGALTLDGAPGATDPVVSALRAGDGDTAGTPATADAVELTAPAERPQGANPFRALYVPPVETEESGSVDDSADADAGTTGTPVADTSPTTSPTAPTTTTPVTTPPATPAVTTPVPGPPADPVATTYPLALVSVNPQPAGTPTYTFTVDGASVEVFSGQRFGKQGELVVLGVVVVGAADLTPTGAIVQVGDDAPVQVKTGETVQVL